jgi:hypothetical protein
MPDTHGWLSRDNPGEIAKGGQVALVLRAPWAHPGPEQSNGPIEVHQNKWPRMSTAVWRPNHPALHVKSKTNCGKSHARSGVGKTNVRARTSSYLVGGAAVVGEEGHKKKWLSDESEELRGGHSFKTMAKIAKIEAR